MANNKKMTKRDYFNAIKSKYPLTEDEVKFIDHELELLAKKNVNKSGEKNLTPRQKENEIFKGEILSVIANTPHTVTEILKKGNFPEEMTNQRVSALLTQLISEAKIFRTEEKGKALFKAVED